LGVTVHFSNNGYILTKEGSDIHVKSKDEVMLYANRLYNLHLEHHIDNIPFHSSVVTFGHKPNNLQM